MAMSDFGDNLPLDKGTEMCLFLNHLCQDVKSVGVIVTHPEIFITIMVKIIIKGK